MIAIEAIEGVCAFFCLMFEKPVLLLVLIVGGVVYLTLIHAEEKPIKHHKPKTEVVSKFIRGGINAIREAK